MVRTELVARIAEQYPHLYAKDVEAIVNAILNRIGTALADGDRVELRDFRAFSVRKHFPQTGRNPRTGASVEVGEIASVYFKPDKAIRQQLRLKLLNYEDALGRILIWNHS